MIGGKKMKKFSSKILCLTLVAASIMAFASVSAIASDTPTKNQGFIPSDDSTWGDLYRHFDPEGFADLSPEVKQVYNSTLLNHNTASPTHTTAAPDFAAAFMEAHGMTDYVSASTTITILPKEDVET